MMKWLDTLGAKARLALVGAIVAAVGGAATAAGLPAELVAALRVVARAVLGLFVSN